MSPGCGVRLRSGLTLSPEVSYGELSSVHGALPVCSAGLAADDTAI